MYTCNKYYINTGLCKYMYMKCITFHAHVLRQPCMYMYVVLITL